MGLESVKEEVIRNAKEQASSMLAEARKEAAKIMRDAEAKAEEMKSKSESETKKIIETLKRQELASAELDSRKLVLDAKKQAIESVISEARKQLEALDDKKREACIKKLLDKASKEIDVAYVYCSRKDAKFVKGFEAINSNIFGGIMAENKEQTIRVDYAFETLLETIKETEMQNLNKILFD